MRLETKQGFCKIAGVTAVIAGLTPIFLCFGLLASDPEAYCRAVIKMGVISFIVSFVSAVLMQLD